MRWPWLAGAVHLLRNYRYRCTQAGTLNGMGLLRDPALRNLSEQPRLRPAIIFNHIQHARRIDPSSSLHAHDVPCLRILINVYRIG